MKNYLIEFFEYNKTANLKLLEVIKQLPERDEAIKLFCHLITSQDKWLNRICREIDDAELSWFGPVFNVDQLEQKWTASCQKWIDLLQSESELYLENDVFFSRPSDSKRMAVKLQDIVLQLNYHSIHHRAQINNLISKQGLTPPPTDYIFTAIREV